MCKLLAICFAFVCFSLCSAAQTSTDMHLIKNAVRLNGCSSGDTKHSSILGQSGNPLKITSFLLLLFYQKIISEQVSAECEFDMSCSAFSVNAIKEFGIVKAIGLTADRLTRCNGIAQSETENHLINHTTGKVIDEPSMYRFNK